MPSGLAFPPKAHPMQDSPSQHHNEPTPDVEILLDVPQPFLDLGCVLSERIFHLVSPFGRILDHPRQHTKPYVQSRLAHERGTWSGSSNYSGLALISAAPAACTAPAQLQT